MESEKRNSAKKTFDVFIRRQKEIEGYVHSNESLQQHNAKE